MTKLVRVQLVLSLLAGLLVFQVGPSAQHAQAAAGSCSVNGVVGESTNATTGLRVVKYETATDTTDATCSFVVPDGITSVRVLSVSGGGGGGWDGGGGGGGGGVNKYDNYAVTPGATIVVTVGGGGAAATSSTAAGNGGTSSFNNERASGGGAGGSKLSAGSANGTGSAGGAGHTNNNSVTRAGGSATKSPANINFENDGGSSIGDYAGGGGGAGSAGANATTTAAGNGGAGFYSSIEGNGATYGGGGGGGTWKAATATTGGSGGGGAGATQDISGVNGTDGLGGGGGGGGRADVSRLPGRGGSGVVLVSYKVTDTCTSTSSTSGGFTTVVFANTTSQISNCRTTWSVPSGVSTVSVLVVAGGGGGGGQFVAGGGGGGGYIYSTSQSVSGTVTVQVGGGGKGGETLTTGVTRYGNSGFDGGNSIFGSQTAIGGGGGGAHNVWIDGRSGGSGGGGAVATSSPTFGSGGGATTGQGNAGAAGKWLSGSDPGGGGGGYGSAGSEGSGTRGGAGGSGTANPFTGISVNSVTISTVAAGGGGGSNNTGGLGGSSIGGAGGGLNSSGANASANTGSGGGGAGGGGLSASVVGGNGSAGIVVIKYSVTLNVTFNSQGGSAVSSTTVLTSATLSAPTDPTRTGYDLSGWSLTSNGSVVSFPFTHGQTADFTLYAIWTRNSSCLPTSTTVSGSTVVTINAGIQTTSCSTTWTVPAGVTTVEMLVVGGGGSGAYYYGGGGGGGAITTGLYSVTAGATLNVTVGGGGASKSGSNFTKVDGSDGSASSVTIGATTYTSNGGKAGIGCSASGAGATFTCNSTNVGGASGNSSAGAGGQGVYSTGLSAVGVAGTAGLASTISGSSVTYGSGGDGASSYVLAASSGNADTGSGGAGVRAPDYGGSVTSGAGAAGVVIFRYSDTAPSTTGSFTLTSNRRIGQSVGINTNTVSTSGRVVTTTYQWQKATSGSYSDISGATSSTYTIQDSDYGATLKLVITYRNSGSSTSVSATSSAVLYAAPTISAASFTGTTIIGNTLTAAATTTGSGTTLTYQWYRSDTQSGTYSAISSATNSTYTTVSADASKWIKVTITVTNDGGTANLTSSASQISGAQLSTPTAPTVTATSGSTTSITVSFTPVTNASSHTVKVYASGVLIGSARTAFTSGSTVTGLSAGTTYTVTVTAIGDGTIYTDSLESSATSVTTNAAALSATISSQPSSATKYAGQSVTFSVTASTSDGGNLSYQWRKNGTNISGANTSSYAINSVASGDAGDYTVVVTNTLNGTTATTTSNAATLTFATATQLSTPSAPTVTATSGSTTSITVSYSSVANADSYTVKVYASGVLIGSARTAFTSGSTVTGLTAGTSYTVTVTAIGDGTIYSDSAASAATSVVTNSVAVAPVISSQPSSATKYAGQSITFSVTATASDGGNLSYQWSKGGSAISGATSSSYTIASVSSGDAGSYTVVVTNTLNATTATTTSNAGILTFATATQLSTPSAPTVTSTSGSTTSIGVTYTSIANATSHTIKVYASGVLVGSAYTSFISGTTITGLSAGTTYTVTVTAIGDGTVYTDSAESGASTITTNAAAVVPTISSQPTSATKYAGQSITFSVTASVTDSGSLSYQWSKGGSAISGATSSSYTIASVSSSDAGDYTVVITNSKNGTTASATSNPATLTFATATQLSTPSAPTVTATSGSTTSITVSFTSVTNASSHTVKVYASGVLVGTAHTSFVSGSTVTGLSAGTTYTVTVTAIGDGTIYTDSAASAATSVTTNAVAVAPVISTQPSSATKYAGQSVTFSVSATVSDSGSLTYQWSKSGSAISGATSSTYTVASVSSGDAGNYSVLITNTKNGTTATTTSNAATLTFATATQLSTPTAPTVTAASGSTTSITVSFTSVTNASSHTVKIYASGVLVGSARTAFTSGSTVTGLTAGTTYTVTVTAIGDGTIYTDSSESSATSVTTSAESNTINFSAISNKTYGDSFSLTVSASSGLTVTVTSSTTTVCTVTTLMVTAISVGTCTLVASQGGNGTYPAATSVTNSFTIGKKTLVITASDQSGTVGNSTVAPSYSQTGLITSLGDAISSVSYTYAGTGSTRYPESSSAPASGGNWILGTYKITPSALVLSSGSTSNYTISYVQGTLTVSGTSAKGISGISVKSTGLNKTTELLTGFSASTTSYGIYVESAVTSVTVLITRESGSLASAQVSVNDSGYRKISFASNVANSGILALPQQSNTITVKIVATDLSVQTYSISILRDQATSSATGGVATPTPTASPRAATQVINSVAFYVNSTSGETSSMIEVSMNRAFDKTISSYSVSYTNAQSVTQLRTTFTDPGITIRVKINQGAFRTIPSTGASTSLPLNVGANTAILRVASSDGTVTDYTFTLNRAAS